MQLNLMKKHLQNLENYRFGVFSCFSSG